MSSQHNSIAEQLRDIAALLTLRREGAFKIAAYERGADAIEAVGSALEGLLARDRLQDIPGIGRALEAQIQEIHRTGRSSLRDRLAAELPEGALPIARATGLSERSIRALVDGLGVHTVEELRAACQDGRVRRLPGFGEKREKSILGRLDTEAAPRDRRMLLARAMTIADELVAEMGAWPGVLSAEVAGDVRRGEELVSEIVVVLSTRRPRDGIGRVTKQKWVTLVREENDRSCRVLLASGVELVVIAARPEAAAATLQRATGSTAHNQALDAVADHARLRIDVDGLHDTEHDTLLPVTTEAALYRRLGMAFVPASLRDGAGEIEAALAGELPRLVEEGDIRGMVHCHTDYSDGIETIERMALAARELGMQYLTITDHSPTAHYAHGVEVDRLERQWEDIARAEEKVGIRILRGTESDILRDGALDYPDRILRRLDVIVASIHNRYRLDRKQMTKRVVTALRHPLFKIWGHALGRILLHRAPIDVDLDEVLAAAAESRVAIEINGDPHRLDMAPHLARRARELGLPLVVSVDAHSTGNFGFLRYGIRMAQRAGATREDVLNTLPAASFLEAVRPEATTPSRRKRTPRKAVAARRRPTP